MVKKGSNRCRKAPFEGTLRQESGMNAAYSRSGDQAGSEA